MGTAQRQHDLMWNAIQTATENCRTQQTAGAGPSSYARYLWRGLLISALLYPFAFLLVCLPSYEHWSASQWGPMLEYPYGSRANADVVIFGDSSACFGIDPRLVNAQLGIKSVVLPDTVGSIPATGDEPLEAYLAHNRKPRLIVLYFSAWNLEFGRAAHGRLFEGEEMMLRHMSGREIASFAIHHPFELLAFPFRLCSTGPPVVEGKRLAEANRQLVSLCASTMSLGLHRKRTVGGGGEAMGVRVATPFAAMVTCVCSRAVIQASVISRVVSVQQWAVVFCTAKAHGAPSAEPRPK